MKKAMTPAFVLALFDGEDEGGSGGQTAQNNGGGGTATQTKEAAPKEAVRDGQGRYASIEAAEQRIADLNKENADRRKENSTLKKSVDSIARRTLRSEAKAALMEAGALHPDVVEIFLKTAGDKVKLNDDFEVVGLSDHLDAFKQSHKAFFKAGAESEDDESEGDGKNGGENGDKKDGKQNATATGASTQGGGSDKGDAMRGLPDLRGLSPEERRKAIDAFKRSFGRR